MTVDTLQGEAQHLVLGDVLVFCFHIMKAVSRLIDLFFEKITGDTIVQGKELLHLYKETQNLVEIFSNLDVDRFGDKWGALDLQKPPEAVALTMQSHIEELASRSGSTLIHTLTLEDTE